MDLPEIVPTEITNEPTHKELNEQQSTDKIDLQFLENPLFEGIEEEWDCESNECIRTK